jgi:hypothetical protein
MALPPAQSLGVSWLLAFLGSWRFLALGISWRLGVFAATIARNDPDARRMKQAAPAAKAK